MNSYRYQLFLFLRHIRSINDNLDYKDKVNIIGGAYQYLKTKKFIIFPPPPNVPFIHPYYITFKGRWIVWCIENDKLCCEYIFKDF